MPFLWRGCILNKVFSDLLVVALGVVTSLHIMQAEREKWTNHSMQGSHTPTFGRKITRHFYVNE